MAPHDGMRDFAGVSTFDGATLNDVLSWELQRLRDVGIRSVVTVDLTKPEFGIPVARVVIPGLEGIDGSSRYLPGPRARARLRARGEGGR